VSDTSLVFNIIARDSGLGRALSAVQRGFRAAGQDAEDALARAGSGTENLDRQLEEARTHMRGLAEEFERTGDKTLFGGISRDRSLITSLERTKSALRDTASESHNTEDAGSSLDNVFQRLWSSSGGLGGAMTALIPAVGGVGTNVWSLVTVAIELGAALSVAGPALYVFGGAAASIPGMLSGAIAAIATLKLGLMGLSENWKAMNAPKTGGGGGGGGGAIQDMTPKLRAVEAAQRAVTRSTRDIADAQVALKDATDNVNKAREQEVERIEDLRRSLASARADEEESVQSLAEARMQLSLAEARGNPDEIRRAQIAVDKQAASLEEAKDKTGDLQKESDEAARKGVEGSDAVVQARKQEVAAQRRVQDAVEAHTLAVQQLGDAQDQLKKKMDAAAAGGGALAAVVPKISASAQEFLNVLKSLKPAFDDLRLDIQQRLFEGLGEKLKILAERWFPQLHKSLGDMATTINGVVKTAFDSLSDPKFISNIGIGVDAFRQSLGKIGQAIAGPLVDAWGRLSAAASPFIIMLGDKIAGIVTQFSAWIKKADETGKLQAFMEKATHFASVTFDIFTDLARITGDVISILFGTNAGSTDAWDNLEAAIHKIADWMGNPANQQKISKFLNIFGSAAFWVGDLLVSLDDVWHTGQSFVAWIKSAYDNVKDFFVNLPTEISSFFTWLGGELAALPGKVWGWLSSLPNLIWSIFTTAMSNMAYLVGWGIAQVGHFLVALPGNVASWLKALPGRIQSIVTTSVAWFRNFGPMAYNAMVNVVTYVWRALSGLPGLMWNAGYNAAIGIWNGIVSLAGWLYSKVQNLGISMWNAFMKGIGAASPSRKFAEAGRWAVLGAAKGLDDNAGTLMASAQDLAEGLAGTQLSLGGVDTDALNTQMAMAASGTIAVQAANRKPVEVHTVLHVQGEGAWATAIRKSIRTNNLLQTKG
jgi:hypothetical protein